MNQEQRLLRRRRQKKNSQHQIQFGERISEMI